MTEKLLAGRKELNQANKYDDCVPNRSQNAHIAFHQNKLQDKKASHTGSNVMVHVLYRLYRIT